VIDHVSKKRRSEMMSAVRGKNTAPELLVRKAAHSLGLRFRLHSRQLPGRPDVVFPKWGTALFVNGCFWHRHPLCKKATTPKSNVPFWKSKFRENTRRDAANYAKLEALGWRVIVLWQCEVRTLDQATKRLKPYFTKRHWVRKV
jgi:DNA mismatch endonuclease (patch repair protein)